MCSGYVSVFSKKKEDALASAEELKIGLSHLDENITFEKFDKVSDDKYRQYFKSVLSGKEIVDFLEGTAKFQIYNVTNR